MAKQSGWRDDPTGRHQHRYHDGTNWTEHVADDGVASTDPIGLGSIVPLLRGTLRGGVKDISERLGGPTQTPGRGVVRSRAISSTEVYDWIFREVIEPFGSLLEAATSGAVSADNVSMLKRGMAAEVGDLIRRLVVDDGEISDYEMPLVTAITAIALNKKNILQFDAVTDEGARQEVRDSVLEIETVATFPSPVLEACKQVDVALAEAGMSPQPCLVDEYLTSLDRAGRYAIAQGALRGTSAEALLHDYLASQREAVSGGDDDSGPVAAGSETESAAALPELLAELDALVGLTEVKEEVRTRINLLRIEQQKIEAGLPVSATSHHLVFSGNPGTGKTTVARLLSRIYAAVGVLSKGHLVETSRADLVAGYVGQTALKTGQVFSKALGGTLFIDEAYSLNRGGQDFGQEAIDALVKLMEDHRDETVVIVAGYTDKMSEFIRSNPGLESRFKQVIEFPDYTDDELLEIFVKCCSDNEIVLDAACEERARAVLASLPRGEDFGNGRAVRRVFENALSRQANRLVAESTDLGEPLGREQLASLAPSDIEAVE